MSAQHHGPRHQKTSQKVHIESLLAAGKLNTHQIAAETNRSLDYVRQIQTYHSRTNGDTPPAGDCDKHLQHVFAANRWGFHALDIKPAYRVRA